MGLFGGGGSGGNPWSAFLMGQGLQNATGAIKEGYKAALGEYGKNYFDPYSRSGGEANEMYANALGLRGAGGSSAAQRAFQTGPGYQFAMDQGTQALDRSAAGRGLFGSGNAAAALTGFGQGLANQEYGNWLSRLQGLGAQGLQAAGGQTGRQGSLANIHMGQANQLANVNMEGMKNISNMLNSAYNNQQQQEGQGQSNLWSAIFGGANLASKFLPYLSDRTMKTDIEPLGRDEEGTMLYAYRYKNDPKTYPKVVGPMAQDIEEERPDAVRRVGGKLVVRA